MNDLARAAASDEAIEKREAEKNGVGDCLPTTVLKAQNHINGRSHCGVWEMVLLNFVSYRQNSAVVRALAKDFGVIEHESVGGMI